MRHKIYLGFLKTIFISLFGVLTLNMTGQNKVYKHNHNLSCQQENSFNKVFDDTSYDVSFYHIDVNIGVDQQYVHGNVMMNITALEEISSLTLDLDEAYVIDSILGVSSFSFDNNEILVELNSPQSAGDDFSIQVFYQGIPPLAGGYKGLRYETHDGVEPIIASLSTPYLAHTWWPCNDGPTDKADSVFVDITIKDTIVSGIQLMAVSNGILAGVDDLPQNEKKYKWRHRYPIVPYYVMVAISNYAIIEEQYDNGSESFPLVYYVFEDNITSSTDGVEEIPEVMDFFTEIFGPYPFADEKYGMTELGYYGGIENQTNTIINNMSEGWFMISVHELAHMWFADMITCEDWHHGWLNEGFASYAEALWVEEKNGINAYHNYMVGFEFYSGGSVYMPDVSNPFTLFQGIIYDKGGYVLHMLRHVLGDEVFFDCLLQYSNSSDHQYKHATSEEFQELCETISGEDLTMFFDQWIYDEYYPVYEYDYLQNGDFDTELVILQTQNDDGWREVFEMPIDVFITFNDATDTLIVVQNDLVLQSYDFSFDKEISSVVLDPNNWILKFATLTDLGVSIDDGFINNQDFVLYPNPVIEELSINFYNSSSKPELIRIVDTNGKVVLTEPTKNSSDKWNVNLSSMASGYYIIEVVFEEEIIRKTFVVEE